MKYSAMVFAFGEPLLLIMGDDAPREVRLSALKIIVTAWNALVADEALGTSEHVEELRRSVAALPAAGCSSAARSRNSSSASACCFAKSAG